LVLWATLHVALGVLMGLYCGARSVAAKLTALWDIDIHVVTLYWHFLAFTVALTVAVLAGFPLLVR
jgi:cytochrome c oxidase subunit I+III